MQLFTAEIASHMPLPGIEIKPLGISGLWLLTATDVCVASTTCG
jgi:hypothetical protein